MKKSSYISYMFSNTQLIEAIQELPLALQQEVALFVRYLRERPRIQVTGYSPVLDLPNYTQPLDLPSYRIQEADLQALEGLWDDEEDAETLCSMLTA